MTGVERWYVLQDRDGQPVRVWGDVESAVREGFAAVADGDDNLVAVIPATESDELSRLRELIAQAANDLEDAADPLDVARTLRSHLFGGQSAASPRTEQTGETE